MRALRACSTRRRGRRKGRELASISPPPQPRKHANWLPPTHTRTQSTIQSALSHHCHSTVDDVRAAGLVCLKSCATSGLYSSSFSSCACRYRLRSSPSAARLRPPYRHEPLPARACKSHAQHSSRTHPSLHTPRSGKHPNLQGVCRTGHFSRHKQTAKLAESYRIEYLPSRRYHTQKTRQAAPCTLAGAPTYPLARVPVGRACWRPRAP